MKIGRHAGTGRFTPVRQAIRYPNTHVVETIKRDDEAKDKDK